MWKKYFGGSTPGAEKKRRSLRRRSSKGKVKAVAAEAAAEAPHSPGAEEEKTVRKVASQSLSQREAEILRQLSLGETPRVIDDLDPTRVFSDIYVPIIDEVSGEAVKLGSGVYGEVSLWTDRKKLSKLTVRDLKSQSVSPPPSSAMSASESPESAVKPSSSSATASAADSSAAADTSGTVDDSELKRDVSLIDAAGRKFAVKTIKKMALLRKSDKTKIRLRYLRSMRGEVDVLRKMAEKSGVGKEHVIGWVDVFEDDTTVRIVTEYFRGGELSGFLKKRRLKESRAKRIVWQIVQALYYIHEDCSAVHCDLKPENVMFSDEHRKHVCVIDFGMARIVEPGDLLSDPCGSPYYTAPEIINTRSRKAAYSQPCDIWALGCLVFVILFGYPAFAVDASQHSDGDSVKRAIYLKILEGFFPSVYNVSTAGYGPWFPDKVAVSENARDFITRCLVKEVDDRADISELIWHPWFDSERPTTLEESSMKSTTGSTFSMLTPRHSDTTMAFSMVRLSHSMNSVIVSESEHSTPVLSRPSFSSALTPPPHMMSDLSSSSGSGGTGGSRSSAKGSGAMGIERSVLNAQIVSALARFDRNKRDIRDLICKVFEKEIVSENQKLFDYLDELFKEMTTVGSGLAGRKKHKSKHTVLFQEFAMVLRGHSTRLTMSHCLHIWSRLTKPSIFDECRGRVCSSMVKKRDMISAVVLHFLMESDSRISDLFDQCMELSSDAIASLTGGATSSAASSSKAVSVPKPGHSAKSTSTSASSSSTSGSMSAVVPKKRRSRFRFSRKSKSSLTMPKEIMDEFKRESGISNTSESVGAIDEGIDINGLILHVKLKVGGVRLTNTAWRSMNEHLCEEYGGTHVGFGEFLSLFDPFFQEPIPEWAESLF